MESQIFTATFISFLIPIVNTIVNPSPFQKEATDNAKQRGWNKYIILVTRACPYLTLYTQFWILVALYFLTPTTMFIGQSLSWFVFILYHGINYIDPMHLAYHPEELVKEVVSWTPPKNKNIVIWFGLHLQHTIFPFYLHYLTNKYNIDYCKNIYAILCSFAAISIYVVWHLFCWYVQGIPAYPFLTKLRLFTHELLFYCAGTVLMVVVNCILAFMWSELIFYFMGIGTTLIIGYILIKSTIDT